jgi:hypothetical protein
MKQEVPFGMGMIPWDKVLAQFSHVLFTSSEHLARERHWLMREIFNYIDYESDTEQ